MRDNSADRSIAPHTWWPAFIPQYSHGENRKLSKVALLLPHGYAHMHTHTFLFFTIFKRKYTECSGTTMVNCAHTEQQSCKRRVWNHVTFKISGKAGWTPLLSLLAVSLLGPQHSVHLPWWCIFTMPCVCTEILSFKIVRNSTTF